MKLKEHSLWIIIVLISISVMGLILLQLYFLNIVVEQKEESFKQNVINTLKSVSAKLETKEARNLVFNYVSDDKHKTDTIHTRYISRTAPAESIIVLNDPANIHHPPAILKGKDSTHYYVSGIFVNDSVKHHKKISKSLNADSMNFSFSFSTSDTGEAKYKYSYSDDSIKFYIESAEGKDITKALQDINKQNRKVFITEIVDQLSMTVLAPLKLILF
jgi:hypothetical protein